MAKFHHEAIYRGKPAMTVLAGASVHICGAGALGSNLAVNLVRMGFEKLCVIDRDRVEEQNIGTQVYGVDDIGGQKAELLRNLIFREVGVEIASHAEELNERNVGKLLKNATLVVDTFDNTAARRAVYEYCRDNGIHCVHAGVNDAYGEIRWNESYRVPSDAGIDVCDYPLARTLITLVVAVTGEMLVRFITSGVKESFSITAGDLKINREIV
jgi:molybdopterin/thiamine biosynthesis adenylyltransferase